MTPVLLLSTAIAIDYSALSSQKNDLQNLADAGAIAGAKELSFSDASRENVDAVVQAVVQRFVAAQDVTFGKASIKSETKITDEPLRVSVTVSRDPVSFFKNFIGYNVDSLSATSVAQITGKPNVCVLALEPSANKAISLEHHANVLGKECSVFSNSSHANAIVAKNSATLVADFICSRGENLAAPATSAPIR